MRDHPTSTAGSARGAWAWLAAALLLAGAALAGVSLSAGHPPPMAAASARPERPDGAGDLSRLPAQAQSVVAAAVGASDPRFAPRRASGGLALAGGGVAVTLGDGGVSVQGGAARLSLGLVSVGRGGRLQRLSAVLPRVRSDRVVYARGGGVLEWYAAGPLGIEQGFTLARRPAGAAGAVTLAVGRAGISARVTGSAVEFLTRSGRVALRYGGLVARDARGRSLHAWLSLSRRRLLVRVVDRGARYPLLIDPLIQQGAKLTASDESGAGQFGYAVALSGDGGTVLVGGPQDGEGLGAAWVFSRSGGTWRQQGPKLTTSDASGRSGFGFSVALSWDGNTALIGAPADNGLVGAAWVFTRAGGTWTQQGAKLIASDESGQGGFGLSVALSGDGATALVGAPSDNSNVGAAWVFTRSGGTWTRQGPKLTASDESTSFPGLFGSSVALSGDGSTALIGGSFDNSKSGAVWVFARSAGVWRQQGSKLTAPEFGGDFGYSVALSLDGRTALVGSPQIDAGPGAGAAWVFARSGGTWSRQGSRLAPTDETGQGHFGAGVALSGDGGTALIGAGADGGSVGATWVFARSGGTWTQQGAKLIASDESGHGAFGSSVALSGDAGTALVGAPSDNGNAGAAWAFGSSPPSRYVYWDNPQVGAIGVATGPPSQIDQSFISDIKTTHRIPTATDGQHIYWSEGGFIARANLDGSGVDRQFIRANPASIAVDAQHVYWTVGQSIGRANLDGSGVDDQFITVPGAFLSGLAVDSGHVYWKEPSHRSIGRANLDGSGVDDTFIAGAGSSGGAVAVDAQHVFWTDVTGFEAPFVGVIGRANLDGTSVTPDFITGVDNPSGLALDDSFVYWASAYSCNYQTDPPTSCGGGMIGRANLDGTGVNRSFVTADPHTGPGCGTSPETRCGPTSVSVATLPDGSRALYWDNPQAGTIGRETLDGDPANVNQRFVTGLKQFGRLGVAVDRRYLYWTNGSWIARSNLDGTGVDSQFVHLDFAALHLAVDDQHIFWSNASWIGRANLDGTGVTPKLITLGNAVTGALAVDSSHIYWADAATGTIGRANLDGTGVDSSFITGTAGVTGVAVDSQHVYWTEVTGGLPPGGSIGRASIDGTGADPGFITGAADPWGIAVDGAHIYWANYYNCDYQTDPPSACAGGTIGRANLDGSAVNQALITADTSVGPGCDTAPQTRCGPTTVAVSAPTQPICLRTSLTPAPVPPPGGAVFSRPLDPAGSGANVVVLPAGVSWTGDGSCLGVSQGSAEVMTHPTSIAVSPHAALLLRDQLSGLVSAWGARDVAAADPAPVLFPGRADWQTTEVDVVAPQQLLTTYGGCPACIVPKTNTFDTLTAPASDPDVGYQGDVSGSTLTGLTFTGTFDGWNFSGANLIDATLSGIGVGGADFTGSDLRGAQLSSLGFTAPPNFRRARIGAVDGSPPCTTFTKTDLVNAQLSDLTADMAGCATIPLLPGSSAPIGLIRELTVADRADVDYTAARFVVGGADHAMLAGVDLHGIDLNDGSGLSGASFRGFSADLENTNFNGAKLSGTNFELADLARATFEDATATKASFTNANLNGAKFTQTTQGSPGADLEGANFIGTDVSGASFDTADISGAHFDHALAVSTDFSSVLAKQTFFNDAHIYGAGGAFDGARDLTGTDFSGAVLAGTTSGTSFDLTDVELAGAKFDNTQCIACNFTGSTLDGANFAGAYLPGAQLANANSLQGASFYNAWLYCGDASNDLCPQDPNTSPNTWDWQLQLGSQEISAPIPFGETTLTNSQWTNVTCPDGTSSPTNDPNDCEGHLLPSSTGTPPPIPTPCSAVALDACPTRTSTLFPASNPPTGNPPAGPPIAVVPASPPTWATALGNGGYYVGMTNATVQLIGSSGSSKLIAGTPNAPCAVPTRPCGDGGPADQAQLGTPNGLATGLDGSLYIADPTLHRVRRVDTSGTITTVAGTGQPCTGPSATCGDGGPATAATLSGPEGVWASPGGELFIADGARGIREVLPDGTITTVGPTPSSYEIVSVTGDGTGKLYAATRNPDYLIRIDPTAAQPATVVVGTGTSGYNGDGSGTAVEINQPASLSVALNGNVIFADTRNNLIRAYRPSTRKVLELGGLITNSGPQGGFNGDNCYADQTTFQNPAAVTVTRGALLVIADTGNARLRQIGPTPLVDPACTPQTQPPPPVGQQPPPPGQTPPGQHRGGHRRRPEPSNHFTVSHVHTYRDGVISFTVKVPGAGTIDTLATAWDNNLAHVAVRLQPARHRFVYGRGHTTVRRAAALRLTLKPNPLGRRLLRHHSYRPVLRLWVSYTPTGGRYRSIGFYGIHLPR